eukprot:ctg_3596.g572
MRLRLLALFNTGAARYVFAVVDWATPARATRAASTQAKEPVLSPDFLRSHGHFRGARTSRTARSGTADVAAVGEARCWRGRVGGATVFPAAGSGGGAQGRRHPGHRRRP